jgi:serine/threonine protein kinase
MPDTARIASDEKPLEQRGAPFEAGGAALLLKQGIAALAPVPLAQGGFGQIYLGKILNPLGLLAERIVWGEENPRWLGLGDIPYEEAAPESPRLPSPMLDPKSRERVYGAAARLWRDYRKRRQEDPLRADEEFKDWLGLIDPMLREDRMIAVKVLQASRPGDSSDGSGGAGESLRRFIKENDLLRRLEHPGIVRRFGLVRDPGLGWCLLLEYIEGKTL